MADQKEYWKKWYAEHREQRREQRRKYYAEHREQISEKNRRRYAEKRELRQHRESIEERLDMLEANIRLIFEMLLKE